MTTLAAIDGVRFAVKHSSMEERVRARSALSNRLLSERSDDFAFDFARLRILTEALRPAAEVERESYQRILLDLEDAHDAARNRLRAEVRRAGIGGDGVAFVIAEIQLIENVQRRTMRAWTTRRQRFRSEDFDRAVEKLDGRIAEYVAVAADVARKNEDPPFTYRTA